MKKQSKKPDKKKKKTVTISKPKKEHCSECSGCQECSEDGNPQEITVKVVCPEWFTKEEAAAAYVIFKLYSIEGFEKFVEMKRLEYNKTAEVKIERIPSIIPDGYKGLPVKGE